MVIQIKFYTTGIFCVQNPSCSICSFILISDGSYSKLINFSYFLWTFGSLNPNEVANSPLSIQVNPVFFQIILKRIFLGPLTCISIGINSKRPSNTSKKVCSAFNCIYPKITIFVIL